MHNEETCENESSNGSCSEKRAEKHGEHHNLGAQGSELSRDEGFGDERRARGQNYGAGNQDGESQRSSGSSMQLVDGSSSGAVIIVIPSSGQREELAADGILKVDVCAEVEGSVSLSSKKIFLERSGSCSEKCRVCHEQSEEVLVELGCSCRGELAKAHHSCIQTWFRSKGSNKCEICQQVAVNIPLPGSQPGSHVNPGYWVWAVEPTLGGGSDIRREEQRRGRVSPLWVAFSILICLLLLDVLMSMTLGLSALPVNIIIGILIVLGLGTALRLVLDCCFEWTLRRVVQRAQSNTNPI